MCKNVFALSHTCLNQKTVLRGSKCTFNAIIQTLIHSKLNNIYVFFKLYCWSHIISYKV